MGKILYENIWSKNTEIQEQKSKIQNTFSLMTLN